MKTLQNAILMCTSTQAGNLRMFSLLPYSPRIQASSEAGSLQRDLPDVKTFWCASSQPGSVAALAAIDDALGLQGEGAASGRMPPWRSLHGSNECVAGHCQAFPGGTRAWRPGRQPSQQAGLRGAANGRGSVAALAAKVQVDVHRGVKGRVARVHGAAGAVRHCGDWQGRKGGGVSANPGVAGACSRGPMRQRGFLVWSGADAEGK